MNWTKTISSTTFTEVLDTGTESMANNFHFRWKLFSKFEKKTTRMVTKLSTKKPEKIPKPGQRLMVNHNNMIPFSELHTITKRWVFGLPVIKRRCLDDFGCIYRIEMKLMTMIRSATVLTFMVNVTIYRGA